MDGDWDTTRHAPTMQADAPRWAVDTSKGVPYYNNKLRKLTAAIALLHYDPSLWMLRSSCLLSLHYPELAAADAHKARLLLDSSLEPNTRSEEALGEKARLTFGMACLLDWHFTWDPQMRMGWDNSRLRVHRHFREDIKQRLRLMERQVWTLLITACQHANAIQDSAALCAEAAARFGEVEGLPSCWDAETRKWLDGLVEAKRAQAARLGMEERDLEDAVLNGSVLRRQYPWIPTTMLERAEATVRELDREMKRATGFKCSVRPSLVASDRSKAANSNLGVFADEPIAKGTEILTSTTGTAVTSNPDRCQICGRLLPPPSANHKTTCSPACLAKFTSTFQRTPTHHPLPTALGPPRHTHRSRHTEYLLLHRFLLLLTAQPLSPTQPCSTHPLHPLLHPAIHALVPCYAPTHRTPWNLTDDVLLPHHLLQTLLAIDLFADLRFDAWVLHTLRLRLRNNQHGAWVGGDGGGGSSSSGADVADSNPNNVNPEKGANKEADYIQALYPSFTLFNHSCAPNISYGLDAETVAAAVAAAMRMATARDIAVGEELFIAYTDVSGLEVAERRGLLRNWLGVECECVRCVGEEGVGPEVVVEMVEGEDG